MKKILGVMLFSVFCLKGWAQSRVSDEQAILAFLSYIASKEWAPFGQHTMEYFDTVTDKYLIFYKNDTTNLRFRKHYLLTEIKRLSKQIQHVNKKNLQIVPYDKAPDSLQIVKLSASYRERSYVAFDRAGSFKRYFLMEGGKIDAFVLWGKTAFAKLN